MTALGLLTVTGEVTAISVVVVRWAITCETAEALLGLKVPGFVGTNVAVIECDPTLSIEVLNEAIPGADPLSAALPIKTPPSKKETAPTGAVAGVGVSATVAVNVTGVPSVAEVGAVKTVVVSSWAALIPVAAQRKNAKKRRQRNIPDGMDRAIEVTFVWTAAVRTPRKGLLTY